MGKNSTNQKDVTRRSCILLPRASPLLEAIRNKVVSELVVGSKKDIETSLLSFYEVAHSAHGLEDFNTTWER